MDPLQPHGKDQSSALHLFRKDTENKVDSGFGSKARCDVRISGETAGLDVMSSRFSPEDESQNHFR